MSKKRADIMIISFVLAISLLPLVSAQFLLSDVLSYIDTQTIFILVCFGVLGLFLKTILDRFAAFRGTTAGIMSVLLSLGATWSINKWFSLNDLLSQIGFSGDVLPYLLAVFLIVFVLCLWKFKWKALFILGLFLIAISLLTDLVYEKEIVLIAGIVLVLISLIWFWKAKKKPNPVNPNQSSSNQPQQINGMQRLIIEAKEYRKEADRQPNPKMYRNWTHFINYLKRRGYGSDEKEICQRIMVSQSDISSVVKKYII
jgi:hypothetical protein